MSNLRTIVVVGAGLAGLRTAEALHRFGWSERTVVVGEEKYMPYTRPPLSKALLTGGGSHADVALKLREGPEFEWLLNTRVTAARLDDHQLDLSDGSGIEYDGLVVATGVRPRRLPERLSQGAHVLRTLDDSIHLFLLLSPEAQVVVIGAGFIGCELAAAATARGAQVTVVAVDPVPMEIALGTSVGSELQRRHEAAGVTFRLGTSVERVSRDAVVLGDGSRLPADVVVEAIGSAPNVEWLEGNGFDLSDGVLCDSRLRVEGVSGVVAAGDVARFPNVLFDSTPRRVEHWQTAVDTGLTAARSLVQELGGGESAEPFAVVPTFWSNQDVVNIRAFGMPSLANASRVIAGDLDDAAAISYLRDGVPVGVVLLGMARDAGRYARELTQQLQDGRADGTVAATS